MKKIFLFFTALCAAIIVAVILFPSVFSAQHSEKYAVLTFDDGPTQKYTSGILDVLKDENVRATFFIVGINVERHPALTRRIALEGHEIGNHSFRHFNPVPKSTGYLEHDLERTNSAIEKITGKKPVLFRPPYGTILPFMNEALKRENMKLVMWDINPNPHPNDTEFSVQENIVFAQSDYLIVVMHDNSLRGKDAIKFLPGIITELRLRGYRFVTASELLELKAKALK